MPAWAIASAATIAIAFVASPAAQAALPVHLGQAAAASNSGFNSGAGGCDCTVAQFQDVGPTENSYTVPFDGVIVASGFYVGASVEASEAPTVQVQTVKKTGASAGNVVSEGAAHGLFGLPTSTVDRFYERLPAQAGDVLAARFHSSYFIETTPYFFKTAASGDGALLSTARGAGSSLETSGPPTAERRLNLEAELEPDADGDGYGDASQDLCLGSPIGAAACSGSLVGSDLQGPRTALAACGSGGCMRVQTTVGGVSTAAPFKGVVVRWRVLNGGTGNYRARVVTFNAAASGGGFLKYKVQRSSAVQSVVAPLGSLASKLSTFPTRLPIEAGDYVALSGGVVNLGFQASTGAATYISTDEVGDGITATGQSQNGTVLYDADIEPDRDGDGYGDVSQDSCPSSATIHEGTCPAPPVGSGGDGGSGGGGSSQQGSASAAAARVGSLAVKPKSFRAKPVGDSTIRGATGAKLKLDVSARATVTLAVSNKKGKRLWTSTRSLGPGPVSIPFSGQYRHRGKVLDLPPGAYRLSATVAGASGPAVSAPFSVLPPT